MHQRKWSEYNKHLVQRGNIFFLSTQKFFVSCANPIFLIAVNERTGEGISECTTTSHVADSSVVRELLDKVPGQVKCIIADGAYDRKSVRDVLIKKRTKGLIPPLRMHVIGAVVAIEMKRVQHRDESFIDIIAGYRTNF